MKKIDFHIHTFSTVKDNGFEFDLNVLESYVKELEIDAIAITNHNKFIRKQYEEICNKLGCIVFPGIEVDLENGHVLIIAPLDMVDTFEMQCNSISNMIPTGNERIIVSELMRVFNNMNQYLVIPHYHKSPRVSEEELQQLNSYIVAGEVQSPKNWLTTKKDTTDLTPVLFSDFREYDTKKENYTFPIRQTYIDCEELTIPKIKLTLSERKNVYLTNDKNDDQFPLLSDGTTASNGLNVIIGKRSSGKSHTLDTINNSYNGTDVKYIKQFQLIKKSDDEIFQQIVNRQHDAAIDDYLDKLKIIIDRLLKYDYKSERTQIEEYLRTLKAYGKSSEKQDIYSSTRIFSEDLLTKISNDELKKLIESLIFILENKSYHEEIQKYVILSGYPKLIINLINIYRKNQLSNIIIDNVNEIVSNIKTDLGKKSAVIPIIEFDFIDAFRNIVFTENFNKLIELGGESRKISDNPVFDFHMISIISPVKRASELNYLCKTKNTMSIFSGTHDTPFQYFEKLINSKDEIDLAIADIFRAFWFIDYKVLNKYDKELSGGEKAEFNLLAELQDSSKYEIILIDEPESSFDNIFIKDNVIEMIKNLALKSTVFVVTHNNTLGVLLKPDCIIYTQKTETADGEVYDVYTGKLTSKFFNSVTGKEVKAFKVLMGTMEASYNAYTERKGIYDSIKD